MEVTELEHQKLIAAIDRDAAVIEQQSEVLEYHMSTLLTIFSASLDKDD